MPEHTRYDDEELFNRETHHEQSDVPIRPLWWALIIFVVFAIVTHIILAFFYKGLAKAERDRMAPPQTAIARPANADVPQNEPLLQPFPRREKPEAEPIAPPTDTPVADLIRMRAAEKQALTSYGWIDRQQGIVRIPIDEAKAIVASRLAVQGQTGGIAAPAATSTAPAAPSSSQAPSGSAIPSDTGVTPAATGNDGVRP